MSKIEKTLELNITHEILSLADSFWWFLQPVSLKRYWRPHWRFPLMQTPKSYATGLHINLEGKTGGGYDVCIKSPTNFQGGNPRLLFMQFKAGIEQQFNINPQSIFFGDASHPNIHVEFEINSNSNKNQHRLLRELAANAGNGNAVVYVFPRIVNELQLQQNIGNLLKKTSFISINDIDAKATANGVTIDDNNSHKFRTCYNDYNRNELNYFFFLFGKQNNPGGMLGEIFAIRMFRALQELKKAQVDQYLISKYHIMDAMIRHVLNIGLYYSISFSDVVKHFEKYPEFQKRFDTKDYYDNDLPKVYHIERTENEFVLNVYNDIVNSFSPYFEWMEEIQYFIDSKVPNPPAEHTIELEADELRFRVAENIFNIEDYDDINYSLL
ncbi:MAG: hypothetical protein ABSC53_04250 [Bacteroidota bacterium]